MRKILFESSDRVQKRCLPSFIRYLGDGYYSSLRRPGPLEIAWPVRGVPGHLRVQSGQPLSDDPAYRGRRSQRYNSVVRIEIVENSVSGKVAVRALVLCTSVLEQTVDNNVLIDCADNNGS